MKEIEPELQKIRKSTSDKQQQALLQMQLYREKGVNPFSSFFLLLLQLPIIYSLYYIFVESGLPVVDNSVLYSFVKIPEISMHFLGIFDISTRSILLSLVAALAQYLQLHFSFTPMASQDGAPNPVMDMMKNMKYIFPVIVFLISYKISAVVAVYWTISSLFTLGQELAVRRHLRRHEPL
jgi:YidC/Oxa1 family membrane protein insertase